MSYPLSPHRLGYSVWSSQAPLAPEIVGLEIVGHVAALVAALVVVLVVAPGVVPAAAHAFGPSVVGHVE